MDILDTLNIAGSGLSAQRLRLQTIASNMANARTTRTEDGTPYQRRVPIFETLAVDPFGSDVERNIAQVEVSSVETIEDFVEVYDPSHPDADEDGFVSFPDINILEEMVDMMTTSRTYESNLKVVDLTREMAMKAIELGR
jgi:flagellar basal-body rod protein FlgC